MCEGVLVITNSHDCTKYGCEGTSCTVRVNSLTTQSPKLHCVASRSHSTIAIAMKGSSQPSVGSNEGKHSNDASGTITGWKDKACRVCDSFSFFKKSMSHQAASGDEQATTANATPHPTSAPPATDADDAWTNPNGALPCPPDYTDLGNSAWAFLHTVASYYPEQPTEQVRVLKDHYKAYFVVTRTATPHVDRP